jgi:tRNA (mo5U34)-methyltransferase
MNAEEKRLLRSFRFADGTEFEGVLPVEVSETRYAQFPLPDDLTGKTVLDIGAWDGWFAFEAERHGAEVTALDTIEVPNFWVAHRKLGSRAVYRELDLFEIPQSHLGTFDYVLFLGVLYHTKHPLLALEIVCGATREIAIVESYVTDSRDWRQHVRDIPSMEFYETDELGGQLDNWVGPTVGCLIALCRAAGFARVEVLSTQDNRAALACYRKWTPEPVAAGVPKTALARVANSVRGGINFKSSRDEYLSWWFEPAADRQGIAREEILLEVDGLGVVATWVGKAAQGWLANSRMPPNLGGGWHGARMKIPGRDWSDPVRFAIDVEPRAANLAINIACDGTTWERNVVDLSQRPAHLSLWVTGLGENADEANVAVDIGPVKLRVIYVSDADAEGSRQINADWPADLGPGSYQAIVRHAGSVSEPVSLLARA